MDEGDKVSERLCLATRIGRPLGNEDFIGEFERVTGRDPRNTQLTAVILPAYFAEKSFRRASDTTTGVYGKWQWINLMK